MLTPGDLLAGLFASTDPVPGSVGLLGRLGDDLDILEVRRGGMGEVFICRPRHADATLIQANVALACRIGAHSL